MTKPRAAISWSGGKDSCAALHRVHPQYDVVSMVTMFDEDAERSRSHVIFGDIMFDEHRLWAERMCEASGLTAVEPLWGESTETLFHEWVASGAEAVIVTARAEFLDHTWLGRPLRAELLPELHRLGVDPCGERGEYHTVVTDSPLFSRPVRLRREGHVQRSGCWAADLALVPEDIAHAARH